MDQPQPSPETTTNIDSLLETLKSRGRRELTGLSVELGVSPNILESWAKVLEEAKLIKVSYEVGKMYLEPINIAPGEQQAVRVKVEAQKFAVQNKMELERVSMDNFSKALDALSANVSGMEALYKQKLPNVQEMFNELDRLYEPIEQKANAFLRMQKSSEEYMAQMSRKMEELNARASITSSDDAFAELKHRLEELSVMLKRAEAARESMHELEDTKHAFYQSLEAEADARTMEFKQKIRKSLDDIYTGLKSEGSDAESVVRAIREQQAEAARLAREVNEVKRDTEAARRALSSAIIGFRDRRQRALDEMKAISTGFNSKYKLMSESVKAIKAAFGSISEIDEQIKASKAAIAGLVSDVAEARKEVNLIMEELHALDSDKEMPMYKKAKAMDELESHADKAEAIGNKIKRGIEREKERVKRGKGEVEG